MASVLKVDEQHKSLIIKLCDMMDPKYPTYKNFIVFLGASIPIGRLSRVQENPTEVFALMEEVGLLKAGEYQHLKKALNASGYINILDILKNEEERITRPKRKRRYSDGPGADGSSNIEAATMSSVKPEGHVMISYRRVEKEKAFWIKRVLEKNGYSVWIDEDNLGTRVYQGMANGVEGAHVVLLCISEEYKKSEFCRSEAEQAKTIKKNIIPVKVEDLALDGWLGIITAGYLFVDLSGPHPSEEQMKLLLRKLAEYYSKEFQEPQIEPFVSNVALYGRVPVTRGESNLPIQAHGDDIQRSEGNQLIANPQQDPETSPSSSRTDKEEKLHRKVLSRCLTALVKDLHFENVSMYIEENELFDQITLRDILDQKTTTEKIRVLIQRIQQRDKGTYEKFKECLVHANQKDLKDMLEEEEAKEDVQYTNHRDGILRSERGHMIANPLPSMPGASNITQNRNERQIEPLSSSSSEAVQDRKTSAPSSKTDKEGVDKKKGHVMISYSWKQKEMALWIKTQLENNGYPIWIDEVNMGQKLHTSMAKGVEGAHVVLICMSKTYKGSDNCQKEALYAVKKKKTIIPLIMEDFEPENWLGITTVDYIYYSFNGKCSYEVEMKKLLEVLAKHYNKKFEEPQISPFVSTVVTE